MTPTSVNGTFVPCLESSINTILRQLYPSVAKFSFKIRNENIKYRYKAGETLSELARAYSISPQRIWQIIHDKDK